MLWFTDTQMDVLYIRSYVALASALCYMPAAVPWPLIALVT